MICLYTIHIEELDCIEDSEDILYRGWSIHSTSSTRVVQKRERERERVQTKDTKCTKGNARTTVQYSTAAAQHSKDYTDFMTCQARQLSR